MLMTNTESSDNVHPPEANSAPQQPAGLFTGFEAYQTPTPDDYRRVLTEGLVVPDSNVFLNLYRYIDKTREDLFAVLDKLGDHLWVPNQVLVEFWRNREAVLRDPRDTAKISEELTERCDQAVQTFRTWANRVSLPEERRTVLEAALTQGFETVVDGVSELTDNEAGEFAQNTNKDPVITKLAPILHGRVGDALEKPQHEKAVAEARRRIETKQPPGYKDGGKGDELARGDYFVWEQVLCEAERRRCDVLVVTGDVKEDWWHREHGQTRGPRSELVEEMRQRAGVRLFMLRPDRLLAEAAPALQVDVRGESLQDVERVDRFLEKLPGGRWTEEEVMRQIEERFPDAVAPARVILRWARAEEGITVEGGGGPRDASLVFRVVPGTDVVRSLSRGSGPPTKAPALRSHSGASKAGLRSRTGSCAASFTSGLRNWVLSGTPAHRLTAGRQSTSFRSRMRVQWRQFLRSSMTWHVACGNSCRYGIRQVRPTTFF
jgi:hypothetical protein